MDEPIPPNALPPEMAEMLLRMAREARGHAYAPYSRFPVGAALLTQAGEIYTGCNVENASFGLTICAERTAVAKAVSEGARSFRAIAVVGPQDELPCSPCGSCRQVLYEFGPELQVITPSGEGGEPQVEPIATLLPRAFGPARLQPTGMRG